MPHWGWEYRGLFREWADSGGQPPAWNDPKLEQHSGSLEIKNNKENLRKMDTSKREQSEYSFGVLEDEPTGGGTADDDDEDIEELRNRYVRA